MLVLTQPQEILGLDFVRLIPAVPRPPKPLPGHALSFLVVVADAQVFLEVFFAFVRLYCVFAVTTRRTLPGLEVHVVYPIHRRVSVFC
jgi:hypothetical protein